MGMEAASEEAYGLLLSSIKLNRLLCDFGDLGGRGGTRSEGSLLAIGQRAQKVIRGNKALSFDETACKSRELGTVPCVLCWQLLVAYLL